MDVTSQGARALSFIVAFGAIACVGSGSLAAQASKSKARPPIMLQEEGGFAFGGRIRPGPADSSLHCDHGYTQFSIPVDARTLPLIMWHSTSTKTWESSPGGPLGFQDIFLRRGYSVYVIDLPRQGRASNACVSTSYTPAPGQDQSTFQGWRLGTWTPPGDPTPNAGSQFPRDSAFLNQVLRARYPDNEEFPETDTLEAGAVSALLAKIGPATLITHSGSGSRGWLTAMRTPKVKGIVTFEASVYAFPEGEVPPPPNGSTQLSVSAAEFEALTKIPILVIFGDYIDDFPAWPPRLANARAFVAAVNRHSGDATLIVLPEIGIHGNSHIMMLERNNGQIANIVAKFLHEKGLDRRPGK